MNQYGSVILAEGLGTRIKRSVNEISKTVFEWAKSTAKSSVEKHARDTSERLSPKPRTCRRFGAEAGSGGRGRGRGKGETQSDEFSAQAEATGAQDGGNNNGAQGGGHVAITAGQGNGLKFGQAVSFRKGDLCCLDGKF